MAGNSDQRGYCQVTTTLPNQAMAQQVAGRLIEERLAACAQVMGPVSSTYCWRGTIERRDEWYCHFKTTMARLPALQSRLLELHPYEVPEIIAVPIIDGDAGYLQWIEEAVGRLTDPEPGSDCIQE